MNAELLAIIAILIAIVALWRHQSSRIKKRFSKQLLHSGPITPKHQPPTTIIDDGSRSVVHEGDLRFFQDLADFGSVVNRWLADGDVAGAWRLQELPESRLKLSGSDTPSFGRRYDVFHNQLRLGTLEISACPQYMEKRNVRANIEIDSVRLLPFHSLAAFLDGVAVHLSDQDHTSREYLELQQAIKYALTQVLWDAQRVHDADLSEDWGELELSLTGPADGYFARRDALHRQNDG